MATPALSRIEQALLQILESHPGDALPGRELRSLLRPRGFRRSAPAMVFTMKTLEDKGLVTCHEEVRTVDGVEITDRYYSASFKR